MVVLPPRLVYSLLPVTPRSLVDTFSKVAFLGDLVQLANPDPFTVLHSMVASHSLTLHCYRLIKLYNLYILETKYMQNDLVSNLFFMKLCSFSLFPSTLVPGLYFLIHKYCDMTL